MDTKTINIIIVDDHMLVREGIKSSLENFAGVCVAAEASNGNEALDMLAETRADVVLMDLGMEQMDGIETTIAIRKCYPEVKILALTMHDDESHILHMLKAGATGYILKTVNTEQLEKAIRMVARGEPYFSKRVADVMMNRFMTATKKVTFGFDQLTKREVEILRLIADGMTNPEIAEALVISHRTVDTHRRNLIRKLNAKNTAGLVREAIKNGLVEV